MKAVCAEPSLDEAEELVDVKPERSDIHDERIALEDTGSYVNSEGISADSLCDNGDFKPIYSIGYCDNLDDNDNPRASMAILTFNGIDKLSDFSVNTFGNNTLEYKVLRPEPQTNNKLLCNAWIVPTSKRKKIEEYHSMLKSIDSMLAPMRRHNRLVETTARISNDMKVKLPSQIHFLASPGSTARVLYRILQQQARKMTT